MQFNGVNCFTDIASDSSQFAVPLLADYKINFNYNKITITSK